MSTLAQALAGAPASCSTTRCAQHCCGTANFQLRLPLWHSTSAVESALCSDAEAAQVLLRNRQVMHAFSLLSMPVIRAVDAAVGSTNAMRIDAHGGGGSLTFAACTPAWRIALVRPPRPLLWKCFAAAPVDPRVYLPSQRACGSPLS